MGEYLPSRDAIRPLLSFRIALGAREVKSVHLEVLGGHRSDGSLAGVEAGKVQALHA
jgi:hypothetical protein